MNRFHVLSHTMNATDTREFDEAVTRLYKLGFQFSHKGSGDDMVLTRRRGFKVTEVTVSTDGRVNGKPVSEFIQNL